jgi:hypothetical protein
MITLRYNYNIKTGRFLGVGSDWDVNDINEGSLGDEDIVKGIPENALFVV